MKRPAPHCMADVAEEAAGLEIALPGLTGILGPSRKERHGLLLQMAGRQRAPAGRLLFQGQDTAGLRGQDRRAWRAGCALIPEDGGLDPQMDVICNLLRGSPRRRPVLEGMFRIQPMAEVRRAMGILRDLGIAALAPRRAGALSPVQQQRAAIACALMRAPRVLLAGEPDRGLDAVNARSLMETLCRLPQQHGCSVVVPVSCPEAARRYCSRIAVLPESGSAPVLAASSPAVPGQVVPLPPRQAEDRLPERAG